MTWVVWRQQRAQVLVTLAVLAPVVAVAAFALLDTSFTPAVDEASLKNINPWHQLAMFCAPALLGMFAGAPLFAREIERGTHVFAATQSVGRTRWLATKRAMAGVPLLAAMTVVGVLTAATRLELSTTDYWSFSLMNTPAYETHGPILMGLTGLAFGVGVAAGLLLRNTVTAMVVTIVVYVVLVVSISTFARPHLAETDYETFPVEDQTSIPVGHSDKGLTVDDGFLDADGNDVTEARNACGPGAAPCPEVANTYAVYIPSESYWVLQWREAGIYLGLGVGLLGLSAWALRRRLD